MNNRGFAISTILYGILLMAILIMSSLLSTLSSMKRSNDALLDDAEDFLNNYANKYVEEVVNKPVVGVLRYEEPNCITGDEETCVDIGPQTTYTAGTIIKYKVNSSTTRTFYVMYDNGGTLTMLDRDPIGYAAWDASSVSSKYYGDHGVKGYRGYTCNNGPVTAVEKLEQLTASWTKVNDQEYTMGTDYFADRYRSNALHYHRECEWDTLDPGSTMMEYSCRSPSPGSTNRASPYFYFDWPTRTAKARLITVQEVLELKDKWRTTPKWLSNSGTWTMNTFSEYSPYHSTSDDGDTDFGAAYSTGYISEANPADSRPLRAVIVIDKSVIDY